MKRPFISLLFFLTLLLSNFSSQADTPFITMASTTSTANSGLFETLLPAFSNDSGIEVRVVAVGTGQAVRIARKGDADLLFAHHRPSEEKLLKDGFGKERFDVMYNDFVLVGPKTDPAKTRRCTSPSLAFKKINESQRVFVSRGDDSGTHKRELTLWQDAGITKPGLTGRWYRSTGTGMGTTLNIASGMNAYTLTDRGTWISFKNKADLDILCQGHESLFNPYGVIALSKEKFPHIKYAQSMKFINWITSAKGQKIIADFRVAGQRLFIPNAK
ncbi:ABC-type tungstate transport system, periplasmic binding protein [Candidatus Terasakiella magnetica]|uniref:ABC-type tungstate transport system, periplasmic binding protein n=1 Tax=Candidatus Terasakiella magnetica TaxID=1867952 RepID=A0A1C3RDN5_9PROT|nr:substrate-binding domain-containing protein [Candidatus Terasakiella magnetica]SCA55352.1 ABC-type tungstate transport system, periplasmic binding protein [Candidatus Terasakiella magnetica]